MAVCGSLCFDNDLLFCYQSCTCLLYTSPMKCKKDNINFFLCLENQSDKNNIMTVRDIDVYKRQVLTPTLYILQHHYLDLMDTNNDTVYRSVGKIKVCVKAVSYTHLDVYKRQVQGK